MSHFQSPSGANLNFDLPLFPSPGFSAALAKVPPSPFETDGNDHNALMDISNLDVFADEDYDNILDTSNQPFSLALEIFDANTLCNILRQKISQPPSSWTQRTPHGLVLLVEEQSASSQVPNQIPLQIALEIVSSLLLLQLQDSTSPNLEGASKLIPQQIEAVPPPLERLELYAQGMELLQYLHSLGSVRDILLPNSPLVRYNMQQLSMRVIIESIVFIIKSVQENQKGTPGFDNAVKACWCATEIFNRVLSEELSRFTKFFPHFDHASRATDQKIAYPFLWFNGCVHLVHAQYYVPFLLHFTHCMVSEPPPDNESEYGPLWNAYCSLLTFFFYCSFADQFTSCLLGNQDSPALFAAFELLLQRLQPDLTEFSTHLKFLVLRILTALSEKEDSDFLDFYSHLEASKGLTQLVIFEASKIVDLLPIATSQTVTQSQYVIAREAFRCLESLSREVHQSYLVIENGTLLLLEILSTPSEQFVGYLRAHQSYQQHIALVLFRILSNLNHQVGLLDAGRGKLIDHIYAHCSSIFVVNDLNEIVQAKRIVVQNLISNLFYLFQTVTVQFNHTPQEYTSWANLLQMVEERWNAKFPIQLPTAIPDTVMLSPTPLPSPPPRKPGRPPRVVQPEPEPEDDDTIIEGLGPRTKALKGLAISFGKVPDLNALKTVIKYHGGNILEYVSKSVTHVVCGADQDSIKASSSKIQSAASKQIPAVSENYIYDSIEAGKILPEKNYLVSYHPFNSSVGGGKRGKRKRSSTVRADD